MTTHFFHQSTGNRILFCSGRSVSYVMTSSRLDDVTCKACRRSLLALAKKAA